MGKMIFGSICFVIIGCFLVDPALAQMESENYKIPTSVLSGGGTPMTSEAYQSNATLGQSSPLMNPYDPPTSENYDMDPGFWYTLTASFGADCFWDFEPDQDVDGSDLSEFVIGFVAGDYSEADLADFAAEFGRANCP